ncbi:MAG: tRNA (adenosine(37)-N6)-threonylcarbamoyltransferase complex ATPase subunit type 1 TsaE [Paracoccaceae bacterium]
MSDSGHISLHLPSPEATAALAEKLAPMLQSGDIVLLEGPIGAGKSLFCRAVIQTLLAEEGRVEEVPSPSFTLVQVYETAKAEIWHADLFRLGSADQAAELGLEEAFETAICLVEWPEKLGSLRPGHALTISLSQEGEGDARIASLRASTGRWGPVLRALSPRATEAS